MPEKESQNGRGQEARDEIFVQGVGPGFRVLEEHEEVVEGLRQTLRVFDKVLLTSVSIGEVSPFLQRLIERGDRSLIYDPACRGAYFIPQRPVGEGQEGPDKCPGGWGGRYCEEA